MERINFTADEKELGAMIDSQTCENPAEGEKTAAQLAEYALKNELTRPESAACARLICRFLLHRKNKTRLADCIRENETIRKAVFGRLNTYKHSLIYLTKRIIRENDCDEIREIIELLRTNPYNEPAAKPSSDKWSAEGIISAALKVPEDYLSSGSQAAQAAREFINNSDSSQQLCPKQQPR